jgi:glycosyltransferase involved in cell wall biosynthesis
MRGEIFVDELSDLVGKYKPAIFHSHDFNTIAAGHTITRRFAEEKIAWLHDLHEWVEGLTNIDPERHQQAMADEREAIHTPDFLFTVSPQIGEIYVKTYGLAQTPLTLLNAPLFTNPGAHNCGDIRSALSIPAAVPLGVYCGNVGATRALHEFVPVLAQFPDLHIAFVTNSKGDYLEHLKGLAAEGGGDQRIHFHPYVPPDELPKFLSTATFGFHSLQHYGNGEVALPNKMFEYLHAGIPAIVSDVAAMKEFVTEHRSGITFRAGDVSSVADAVRAVLQTPDSYRPTKELAQRFSWEEQEKKLLHAYEPFLAKLKR